MSEKILARVGLAPKIQLVEYVIRMILVGIIFTLVATIVRFSFETPLIPPGRSYLTP